MSWLIISLHVLTLSGCLGLIAWEVYKSWAVKRVRKAKLGEITSYELSFRNILGEVATLSASGFTYMEGGQVPVGWVKIRELAGSQQDLDDFIDVFSDLEVRRDILVSASTGKRIIIQRPQLALVDAWNDMASGSMKLRNLHMVFFSEVVTAIDASFEVPL